MFTELMPLIEQRPLTITVAVLNGGRQIRVNVVPQTLERDGKVNEKIGYSSKDKIAKVPDEAVKAIEERDKNKTKVKTAAREATTSEDANKPTSISPGLFDTAAPAAATN